jgi:hypothetical protein
MPDLPLPKLRFSGSLHIEVEMDLYEHFTKLSTAFHRDYWEMELAGWGYEEEYERPLAWVMSWLDQDMENADIGRATPGGTRKSHEIEWKEAHVRYLTSDYYPWTESHFEQLISFVPWMVPPEGDRPSREDLFRIPGPNDEPLFDLAHFRTAAGRAAALEATNPHIHPITIPPQGEST